MIYISSSLCKDQKETITQQENKFLKPIPRSVDADNT